MACGQQAMPGPQMTDDDFQLVAVLYARCLEKRGASLSPVEEMVYRVQGYSNEINSGEDFIQWFNWCEPAEVQKLPARLREIGADKSAKICEKASRLVFPGGVPSDRNKYDERLYAIEFEDKFSKLRDQLAGLAAGQIEQNVQLTAALARWIRAHQPEKTTRSAPQSAA
jgi:hypothetical protein